MADFADSPFRFTSPVRFFKANDPIYYEVDNIPLKQLHENDLWLKDQIQKLANPGVNTEGEIDRTLFSELKPYSEGTDNIVRVRPGRFTARINDAYSITPLQYIQNITGDSNIENYQTWLARSPGYGTQIDPFVSGVIARFRANVLSDALNMNGLTERAFSYPAVKPGKASTFLASSTPTVTKIPTSLNLTNSRPSVNDIDQPLYPLRDNQLVGVFTTTTRSLTDFIIKQYDTENVLVGFATLSTAEPEFIKRWRGVARTAVVDVPEELSIEIPAFNANDFFYINENNQKVNLTNATQRIDLLFIYAKPVDADSTTISKFVSTGQPTTITAPALGIVYGAGVGMDYNTGTRAFKNIVSGVLTDNNVGSLKMLPHIGDEAGQTNGFKIGNNLVKGSFPSPDDLMNLTPILDEDLSTNHYGLIGQSVLPIAYIVVKKAASNNANQVNIINSSNIIDIRPFFRTTELSYNERAGLAAAVPAPSLANPVVTQAELKYEFNRISQRTQSIIDSAITQISASAGGGSNNGGPNRILGMGYIFGGLKYGPEGVFANKLATENPSLDLEDVTPLVKELCTIPSSINIPLLPDWEIANWVAKNPNIESPGNKINDRMNLFTAKFRPRPDLAGWGGNGWGRYFYLQYPNTDNKTANRARIEELYLNNNYYPYKHSTTRASVGEFIPGRGWSERNAYPTHGGSNNIGVDNLFWFVRKKFYINLPSNFVDYYVDIKLFNCLNNSAPGLRGGWNVHLANPSNSNSMWIEKGQDNTGKYFVVNVATPTRNYGDRDPSWWQSDGSHHGADYNPYSNHNMNRHYEYVLESNETNDRQGDPGGGVSNPFPYTGNDNSIRAIEGRGGLRPKSFRDVGELTANWLAVSEKIKNESYEFSTEKGAFAMGICNYPSVMFTIIGIGNNFTIDTQGSNNSTPFITI